jgi:HEAT repeat protein
MGESDNIKWVNIVISAVYNDLPEIRYESAVALGKLGDESTLQNLQELLNDEDIQVKNRAIESIGAIGGAMAKRILLSMINEDSESKESLELALENIEV